MYRTSALRFAFAGMLIIIGGFFAAASAQAELGRISGTVTDMNGALIAGAAVSATNQATRTARTAIVTEEGAFTITSLVPGRYTIESTAENFEPIKQADIEVLAGQEKNLTIKLPAKGVTVQVDVISGEDTLTNTASAAMTANVTPREVAGLPLNGRQLAQLYLQAPGAQNTGTGTYSDIRFNGRANEQNVIRYDGVEGTAIIDASPGNLNGEVPSPFRLQSSLENVQEFRVESSNFPAEFGTGTGGQVNVVTKSGGNNFHGSVFEYLRRDGLDARNFFDNATPGVDKSKLSLDQYGFSIGGPIIKEKLFFFGSYERYRGRFGLNFVEAAPALSLAAPGALIPGTSTLVNPSVQPYIAAFRSSDAVVIAGASSAPASCLPSAVPMSCASEPAGRKLKSTVTASRRRCWRRYAHDVTSPARRSRTGACSLSWRINRQKWLQLSRRWWRSGFRSRRYGAARRAWRTSSSR